MSMELAVKGHFLNFSNDVSSVRSPNEPWKLTGVYFETPYIKRTFALTYRTDDGVHMYFSFSVEWSYRYDTDEVRRAMIKGIKSEMHKIPEHHRHKQLEAFCQ